MLGCYTVPYTVPLGLLCLYDALGRVPWKLDKNESVSGSDGGGTHHLNNQMAAASFTDKMTELLEHAATLGFSEGDYLKIANQLQKVHQSGSIGASRHYTFSDGTQFISWKHDRKQYSIDIKDIAFTEQTLENGRTLRRLESLTVEFSIASRGRKQTQTQKIRAIEYCMDWKPIYNFIKMTRPLEMTTSSGGLVNNYKFDKCLADFKKEDDIEAALMTEEERDEFCPSYDTERFWSFVLMPFIDNARCIAEAWL